MPSFRDFLRAVSVALLFVIAQPASAGRYFVPPGSTWETLGPKLKPGDEIVLAEGVHLPATLTGVSGSPFAPIVIHSVGPNSLAEVASDRASIKLVDCRHIRIARILSRTPRRAGILIESTKPGASEGITIEDVLIVGPKGLAEESGIVARGVKELAIRRCRIENPTNAAITIGDCESVTISDVQMVARTDVTPKAAIRLEGRVWSTLIEKSQIAGAFATAFDLGTSECAPLAPREPTKPSTESSTQDGRSEAGSEGGAQIPAKDREKPQGPSQSTSSNDTTKPVQEPLVRFLTISNMRLGGVRRLLDLGSVADATIRNVTLRDAQEEIYRISLPPLGRPAASMRMSECLFIWSPGALRQIGVVAEGAVAKGFTLGANLWWSAELPAALALLGANGDPFPGTREVEQTTNLDPKLDQRSRPTVDTAMTYGYMPD
jgi:hypothetical protein